MIGRRSKRKIETEEAQPKGFDAYDLRLGDVMRGERATLGKSLLDVERELRIRASYIAAIENTDPDAFDTPGFIPGYVRSYARYLDMDPDKAFAQFCAESGFSTAHGMSSAASSIRKADAPLTKPMGTFAADPLIAPKTPFLPASESLFARVEPGAIGSVLVLLALIGGIGYGGYTVLTEIQRVQMTPVENTPSVLAELDPLAGMGRQTDDVLDGAADGFFNPPSMEGFDRLYRPEALDLPVLIARDGPISTLDPARQSALMPEWPDGTSDSAQRRALAQEELAGPPSATPQVLAEAPPGVQLVAVRPAWVRVRGADGSTLFEGIMNAGDIYEVPVTEDAPTLRVGESGAVYFAVNGEHYGPAGPSGSVTSNVALDTASLTERFSLADITQDRDLERHVAELRDAGQSDNP